MKNSPIGVFDSGYGGLTVLKEIVTQLPQYDYLYVGDNARAPYGPRSFETVYEYTLQCVDWLFKQGSSLVILACNTASAKALRTIQQNDLLKYGAKKRVLGVIRPTAEIIGNFTITNKIGILGTTGTVLSNSYPLEINKFFPNVQVFQQACPMWVPLIENNIANTEGANYFIKTDIDLLINQNKNIDTLLLACTHYPLLLDKIKQYTSTNITILSQGKIVADSLKQYLNLHPEIEKQCSKSSKINFFTTDATKDFDINATHFYGMPIQSKHLKL